MAELYVRCTRAILTKMSRVLSEPEDAPAYKPQDKYPVNVCTDATYFLDTEAVCGGSADGGFPLRLKEKGCLQV